jgi:hypothetical protein
VKARLLVLAALIACTTLAVASPPGAWWSDDVEQALAKAKDNRRQLEKG